MITISQKEDCCGCGGCAQRCPRQCITMKEDKEGFLYPVVEESLCIDCGLCEKICHELNEYEKRMPTDIFAAINRDDCIRRQSSSGGVFHLLAERTIRNGGVVFGARFDDNWQVVIDYAETHEGITPFLGSKYVQARTEKSYIHAESFLKNGREVLFSGTPCQIAGLHHFLRKDYDNLVTVDFVCHGVPSLKVWEKYLFEVTENVKRANNIRFRSKRDGWKRFYFELTYEKDSQTVELSSFHGTNHFMRAFLSDMILRPSCHNCKAKEGRSRSDITIADFWGVNAELPEMDDDKGTSLLIINTEKGERLIKWDRLTHKRTNIETVRKYNGGFSSVCTPHRNREKFFSKLDSCDSVTCLIDDMLRLPLASRIRIRLGALKMAITDILKGKKRIGGGKINVSVNTNEELLLLSLPVDRLHISDISFRCKEKGWKKYNIVIKMKVQKNENSNTYTAL